MFGLGQKELSAAPKGQYKNDLALALYGRLRQGQGNLFFSPFSIRTALGMACAGARGETAAQMSQVLGFAASDETLHAAVGALVKRLNASGGGQYEMNVANSLWIQDRTALRSEFLDLMARHYAGGFNSVEFSRDPEAARTLINQWVEDKTRQRIRDLIPLGALGSDTRFVLANAVFFKGLWELPFDEASTRNDPFHLESGAEVPVPLMHQMASVRYMRGDGYQAVDLDYRGGDLSMLVMLPDRKVRLRRLEETFTVSMLDSCVARQSWSQVELSLPRFKVTWTGELGSTVMELGMPLAFGNNADFSGINGCQPPHADSLFLSAVFHKAFVEVNEEGTEVAAATAMMMETTALRVPGKLPPIPVFRADHPFLYAIRDRNSSAILFLGRLDDPTKET